jgi:hypothetical protein
MGAYARISRLVPAFAEVAFPIEEFAVGADWSLEVTFGSPRPEASPGAE